jgi:hypothetical protein
MYFYAVQHWFGMDCLIVKVGVDNVMIWAQIHPCRQFLGALKPRSSPYLAHAWDLYLVFSQQRLHRY